MPVPSPLLPPLLPSPHPDPNIALPEKPLTSPAPALPALDFVFHPRSIAIAGVSAKEVPGFGGGRVGEHDLSHTVWNYLAGTAPTGDTAPHE